VKGVGSRHRPRRSAPREQWVACRARRQPGPEQRLAGIGRPRGCLRGRPAKDLTLVGTDGSNRPGEQGRPSQPATA